MRSCCAEAEERDRRMLQAQQSRGLRLEGKGLLGRARAQLPVLIAMLVAALRSIERLAMALEARGFKSPYLRAFVVARINPVRFIRTKPGDKKPAMPIAAALTRMTAAVKGFDVGNVRPADLALVAALSSD